MLVPPIGRWAANTSLYRPTHKPHAALRGSTANVSNCCECTRKASSLCSRSATHCQTRPLPSICEDRASSYSTRRFSTVVTDAVGFLCFSSMPGNFVFKSSHTSRTDKDVEDSISTDRQDWVNPVLRREVLRSNRPSNRSLSTSFPNILARPTSVCLIEPIRFINSARCCNKTNSSSSAERITSCTCKSVFDNSRLLVWLFIGSSLLSDVG